MIKKNRYVIQRGYTLSKTIFKRNKLKLEKKRSRRTKQKYIF